MATEQLLTATSGVVEGMMPVGRCPASGLESPRVGRDIDGMFLKRTERDDLERSLMRGCKDDVGGGTVQMRLKPVGCGHAPPIARYEPREAILRHWRDQVVADALLVFEKLGGDNSADRVTAKVLGTGVTAAITKEAGNRVGAAGGERSAQDVDISGPVTHVTDLGCR
jgi:hypothetical protein